MPANALHALGTGVSSTMVDGSATTSVPNSSVGTTFHEQLDNLNSSGDMTTQGAC